MFFSLFGSLDDSEKGEENQACLLNELMAHAAVHRDDSLGPALEADNDTNGESTLSLQAGKAHVQIRLNESSASRGNVRLLRRVERLSASQLIL